MTHPDNLSNLTVLNEIEKDMTAEQRTDFESFFIGALAIRVSDEDWKRCIQTARTCYEARHNRA